jgi:hypothetical protein
MEKQRDKNTRPPISPTDAAAERSDPRTTRRDIFKASAVIAGGMASGATGLMARPTEAITEVTANGTKLKVIDFRCRPPLKAYSGLFNLRLNFLAKRPTILANPATGSAPPASVSM